MDKSLFSRQSEQKPKINVFFISQTHNKILLYIFISTYKGGINGPKYVFKHGNAPLKQNLILWDPIALSFEH